MEQYLALLLLIVPGFACQLIYERLNSGRRIENALDKTMMALIYSLGVLAINYGIIRKTHGITTIETVKNQFGSLDFVLIYIGITAVACVVFAVLLTLVHPGLTTIAVNLFRKTRGKEPLGRNETVWDEVFHDGKRHAIIVEKDGALVGKGFIKHMSFAHNEVKEIYLDQLAVVEGRPDLFDQVVGVYLDCKNNLIIREYDLTRAYSELNKSKSA